MPKITIIQKLCLSLCKTPVTAVESHLKTLAGVATLMMLLLVAPHAYGLPANFVQETVVNGVTKPTNLAMLPNGDGRMLVTEQKGRVKIFDPSTIPATSTTILDITSAVDSARERGLATITLDPDFSSNGYFYLYYTHNGDGNRNRISRFTFTDGLTPSADSELMIWEDNEPAMSCCHFGGGMDFGPDEMLYLATGEEFDVTSIPAQAQDLARAGGKIIRLNPAGATLGGWVRGASNLHLIPADNPVFPGAPANALKEIWAYGLRNPFRAHWDLVGNRFFIGEVGGNEQSTAREDLHTGVAGGNYGWPFCEGQCPFPAYEDPIYDYGHTGVTPNGGAIVAGVVYRGNAYPSAYQGNFFFADYVTGSIRYLTFNTDGTVKNDVDFATGADTPVSMEVGPEGFLYVVEYGGTGRGEGRIIRYAHNSGNQPPVVTAATATYTPGTQPLVVDFRANATDADNTAVQLTYHWFFGDGSEAFGQSVQHEYTSNGIYSAFVRVSDLKISTNSDLIEIQAGIPPVVAIDFPVDGSSFRAGESVDYRGRVINGNQSPPYEYQWDIDFVHNSHIHPGGSSTSAADSLYIEPSGHDYLGNTGYDLRLTVTDSVGLSTTRKVTVYPEKVTMNLSTIPAGLDVLVDGLSVPTDASAGFAYDTLINFEHVISVPQSVCDAGTKFEFNRWSGFSAGEPRVHTLTVPATDVDVIASYSSTGTNCTIGSDPGDSSVPTAGLVAHFEADTGVTITGGSVTNWADQSGRANHLTASGNPVRVNGALNGNPVIDFDAIGDSFEKLDPSALPTGAKDRTMYLVANYRGGGWGGVSYGEPSENKTFGLVTDVPGRLTVHGYSADNRAGEPARDTWLIQSAVLTDSQLMHYRDGFLIDVQLQTYETGNEVLKLGEEISGTRDPMDMQIAAVLIYDRSLSFNEQARVQNYLQQKYFGVTINLAPVAIADSASVESGSAIIIDVAGNDTDLNGDLDVATVAITTDGFLGTVTANGDGTVTYLHTSGEGSTDSFEYTISDTEGLVSNSTQVLVSILSEGEEVINRVTSGQQVLYSFSEGSGTIVKDISGITPALDLTIEDSNQVRWQAGTLKITGSTTLTAPMDTRLSDAVSGTNEITVEAWVTPANRTQSGSIVSLWGESGNNDITLSQYECQVDVRSHGADGLEGFRTSQGTLSTRLTHIVYTQSSDGSAAVYLNNVLRSTKELAGDLSAWSEVQNLMLANEPDSNRPWRGTIDLVAVYNRALTTEEVRQNYRAGPDSLGIQEQENALVRSRIESASSKDHLLALSAGQNDLKRKTDRSLSTEALVQSSVSELDDTAVATASVTTAGLDQLAGLADDLASNLPEGLVAMFESDAGLIEDDGVVTSWTDQSGQGNHLTALGNPTVLYGALNGHPVVDLDSIDDQMQRTDPTGLPPELDTGTVFLVANYRGGANGGLVYGNRIDSEAFGLTIDESGRLAVPGQTSTVSSADSVTHTWLVQSAVLGDNQVKHYRDGVLIDSLTRTSHSGFGSGRLALGSGLSSDSVPMDMQIAAVLIYDRALSYAEQAAVQRYLQSKYFGTVNQLAPVAVEDTVQTFPGGLVSLSVVDNDLALNGNLDPSTVVITGGGSLGEAMVNGDGTITYRSNVSGAQQGFAHAIGTSVVDTLEYTVGNAIGLVSNRATITVVIQDH